MLEAEALLWGMYAFGYNGKENIDEMYGSTGTFEDYGMRMYDTRVGRFISVDPLFKDYPWNSTYCFAENSPILYIDLDGLEKAVNDKVVSTTSNFVKINANSLPVVEISAPKTPPKPASNNQAQVCQVFALRF